MNSFSLKVELYERFLLSSWLTVSLWKPDLKKINLKKNIYILKVIKTY